LLHSKSDHDDNLFPFRVKEVAVRDGDFIRGTKEKDLPECPTGPYKIQFLSPSIITIVPVMVSMMSTAAVIVPTIVGRAIVNSLMVILISVPGITVAAVVVAGLVILRCTTESDAEALCLRLVGGRSQHSQDRHYEEKIFH
jgi:hypothetical protein